ncbi:MAG: DUF2339 domain-containing protein [Planctomycetes bacterium]|nr:DUF2339 domain-containing protein [Planctomycetota bacterium]
MEEFWGLWALLAVAALLCGPVALAVSLTALKRIREIQGQLAAERRAGDRPRLTPVFPAPASTSAEGFGGHPPAPGAEVRPTAPGVARPRRESLALEQRIGTRWALVAGVITIVFAVGFFLKYAYESGWIGPLGRVLIAAAGGLLALAIGELTRRRGYDFVAKGVTALGFVILYATVFAAHRWYGLLSSAPAYGLATAITTAAMFYAVVVDEVIVAVLSLAGGYITPVVLSTGENLPTLLFSYVLILSAGAIICAYRRKWGSVSIIGFFGTYLLYMGWWERFYRPALEQGVTPQLGIAVFWLTVFFVVYLIVPLLHTLVRRVRAPAQNIVLALVNGGVVLYFLAAMLMDKHENWLAFGSLLMGVAYLGPAVLVLFRCPDDTNLRITLLLAGLSFASLAVPLYFEANAIALLWAIEAVAFAAVGLRYRNFLIQAAAGLLAALTVGDLLYHLPLHTQPFRPVLNAAFGTWSFVAAAFLAGHVLYRIDKHLDAVVRQAVTQILYAAGLLLLLVAIGMELWDIPINEGETFFERQMIPVFAAFLLLFVARPVAPRGPLCPLLGVSLAAIGSIFLLVVYPRFHEQPFPVFANAGFLRSLILVAALFAAAWLARRDGQKLLEELPVAPLLALFGILMLWLLMTQDIWVHFQLGGRANWRPSAQMYISVLWALYASALMVIGLRWRRRSVRYLGLGIFVLLLAKIFVVDTRTLDVTYRIAGFLATGLALVGVSYLYQYLKKMGFFDPARLNGEAAQDRQRPDDARDG